MAFRIRKLCSIALSSYFISALIAATHKNNCLTLFTPNNPILETWSHRQFCTDQAIPKPLKFAFIHPTAVIEVGAVVHSQSLVGENIYVGSGAIVGHAATIGESTRLGYNVSLSNCSIGNSCVFHNGVCIGQDGFGFFLDEQGTVVKKHQNLKEQIGNHVEIGANTCNDRGKCVMLERDYSRDHSKIDNLVQIEKPLRKVMQALLEHFTAGNSRF